ncbi:MAG: succinylglutamate desuccinylase/aspartoacylase family protein [Bacillota bacterium]
MTRVNGITIDEVVYQEERRVQGFIHVAAKPDNTWVKFPIVVLVGKRDGPTLLVDACTHGDEYEGCEAILQVVNSLDLESLAGTLVAIPALNLEAFCAGTRASPADGKNLNRVFPGNPNLFITDRIAHSYMERVVRHASYMISFHGGGTTLHLEPLVGYFPSPDHVGKTSREMALAFGVKVIWRMSSLPFDGVSTIEAAKLGIPGVLPEIGSHCTRFHERWKNVSLCVNGIMNTMRFLGMVEGDLNQRTDHIEQEMHYIHTSSGGIHVPVKQVLEPAATGDVLAEVKDVFGRPVGQVRAPFDGIVVGYWSLPVIKPGDWSYLFGKLV